MKTPLLPLPWWCELFTGRGFSVCLTLALVGKAVRTMLHTQKKFRLQRRSEYIKFIRHLGSVKWRFHENGLAKPMFSSLGVVVYSSVCATCHKHMSSSHFFALLRGETMLWRGQPDSTAGMCPLALLLHICAAEADYTHSNNSAPRQGHSI